MARLVAPMVYIICPTFALCDIRPRADKSQPFTNCIDVAVRTVNPFNLPRHPIVRYTTTFVQISKYNVQ